MAVALHAATEHGAFQDGKGREQGRGAVAGVVVGLGCGMSWSEGPVGTRALQGLDLALLVDGEHDGMGRRLHVEANHILNLLDEGRAVRALEGADPRRLQAVCLPDPLDGAERPDLRGDGAPGPMGTSSDGSEQVSASTSATVRVG